MTSRVVVAAAFLVLGAHSCIATEVASPPLTTRTLNGVWEGTGGLWYWYRFEIFPGGGYLAYVTSPSRQDQALYRLADSRVANSKVTLHFRNVTKGSTLPEAITIEGRGWADADGGKIYADVTDHITNLREKSHIDFTKGAPTRFVAKMFKDAQRLISDAKANRR
jgi:hypothetical protein